MLIISYLYVVLIHYYSYYVWDLISSACCIESVVIRDTGVQKKIRDHVRAKVWYWVCSRNIGTAELVYMSELGYWGVDSCLICRGMPLDCCTLFGYI